MNLLLDQSPPSPISQIIVIIIGCSADLGSTSIESFQRELQRDTECRQLCGLVQVMWEAFEEALIVDLRADPCPDLADCLQLFIDRFFVEFFFRNFLRQWVDQL